MRSKDTTLIREQMDASLSHYHGLKSLQRPLKGWIRSIRLALGMSGRHLAERLGVQTPRVVELEKAEALGNITLSSLKRAAEAMDCTLIYAFLPHSSLTETVRAQAQKVAADNVTRISHSMLLENQALPKIEQEKILRDKEDELMRTLPRWFWDSL